MKRFLPLLFCAFSMYGGCQLFEINKGKSTAEAKQKQKDLCEKGVKVMAVLQNEYTELKVGSSVSYQYKFDYKVDGKTYTGNMTEKKVLESPIVEVTYNSSNPEIVTTSDPCLVYEKIKDNPSKWPQWIEYIGAGLFLLGFAAIKSSAVTAIRGDNVES